MAEVNDTATQENVEESTKADDTLDKIVPQAQPKKITFSDGVNEVTYIQKPLGFFQKLELFSYLGDAVDQATSGEDGLSISSVLGGGPIGQSANEFDADTFIQGIAKVAKYVPDVLQQSFCILLDVPKVDRKTIIDLMSRPSGEGGLSDDQALEIIETFFDQNAEEVKSFFTDKLQRLSKRWRETFSQESKASSKRSKTTRRTTRKQ